MSRGSTSAKLSKSRPLRFGLSVGSAIKRSGLKPLPTSSLPVDGAIRARGRDLLTIAGIALQWTKPTQALFRAAGEFFSGVGPSLVDEYQSYRITERVGYTGVEKPRYVLIQAIEGMFTAHILVALKRRNVIADMLNGPITINTIVEAAEGEETNQRNILAGMQYFERLGWVQIERETITLTRSGEYIFKRAAAFGVPHSYTDYIYYMDQVLFSGTGALHVDRGPNVLGSGANHGKYFKAAESFIRRSLAKGFCDIGCGSGDFLRSYARKWLPGAKLFGFDLEKVSLDVARDLLDEGAIIEQGNVKDPAKIARTIRDKGSDPNDLLYTVWFIFHEVLGQEDVNLVDLLSAYRENLGCDQGLVICEIFDIPAEILLRQPHHSVAAAYLFFHAISGQKVISWQEWQDAIAASPFEIAEFHPFDMVGGWQKTPWAGVFVLKPKA
ncbi:MAG: class I SAM-dependent methyltransferase [Candidatus Saganbacteria bacterium]|nr:class I SAM-dependent methyltransferase [Candidatus Saganbacteria bacterium]